MNADGATATDSIPGVAPQMTAVSSNVSAAENGGVSASASGVGGAAASVGAKLLGRVLQNVPLVGSVFRLMQGSESHISPSAIAFANSGPDAKGGDAQSGAGSGTPGQNSATQQESVTGNGVAGPSIAAREFLRGVQAAGAAVTGGLDSHVAARDASSGVEPKSEAMHAARDAQAQGAAGGAQGASAAAPQEQVTSDARPSLAEKFGSELQAAFVQAKPEMGDAGSSLGGEAQADANANSAMNQAAAAQTTAVGTVGDGNEAAAIEATPLSADAGAALPRAVVEGVALAAKAQGASGSDAVGADGTNTGAFAQAVSAAGTGAGEGASTQAANSAAVAAESRAFTQAESSPAAQQFPQATTTFQANANSEMRVAMQTDLLGAIDLRAAMHQSTLTATIGVQRADVQTLLANELPALQHALAEKNLQVGQISVLNNHTGGALDSRSSGHDPRHGQMGGGAGGHTGGHGGGESAYTMPYVQAIGQALGEEASMVAGEFYGGVTPGRVNVVV